MGFFIEKNLCSKKNHHLGCFPVCPNFELFKNPIRIKPGFHKKIILFKLFGPHFSSNDVFITYEYPSRQRAKIILYKNHFFSFFIYYFKYNRNFHPEIASPDLDIKFNTTVISIIIFNLFVEITIA